MTTPEGYEKEVVRRYLRKIGAYQFWPVQMGYGAATLDCLACIGGFFCSIEVKKKGYTQAHFTTRQKITMEAVNHAGGKTFAGDGDEIVAQIEKWLNRAD